MRGERREEGRGKRQALLFSLLSLLSSLLFLIPALAQAQTTADRIIDYELGNSRAYEILSHLADNIGPRLTATPQAVEAVRWTTATLRSWGVEVRNEPVLVPRWQRGAEQANLVSHMNQRIALTTLGGSVATPAQGLTAEVVAVRSYDDLKALGDAVRGKIVLYNNPMDRGLVEAGRAFEAYSQAVTFRGSGASRAAEHGAVAALVRSVTTFSMRTPHTGALRYNPALPKIPAAAVAAEDADLIQRLFHKGETVRMHLLLTPQNLGTVVSHNVVAELKGRERPEEIVLIGAHLDSWDLGTGAIDNGSGVAMIMETMRVLKELGLRPRRTIRAVLFMNEENGLRGARNYFVRYRDQLDHHVAAIESDAGTAAPLGFITTLDEDSMARLSRSLQPLERLGATRLTYARQTGADTSPLVGAGVPGFGLSTDSLHYFDYHHSAADTLDKVDPRELAMNSAAVAVLTYTLAEMPERLPRTRP